MSDNKNDKIDTPKTENKLEESLDLDGFEVIEEVSVDLPPESNLDLNKEEGGEEKSASSAIPDGDEFDDFEEIEDDFSAISASAVNRSVQERSGKGKTLFIALLFLCLIGGGGYFMFGNNTTENVSPPVVQAQAQQAEPSAESPESLQVEAALEEEPFFSSLPQPDLPQPETPSVDSIDVTGDTDLSSLIDNELESDSLLDLQVEEEAKEAIETIEGEAVSSPQEINPDEFVSDVPEIESEELIIIGDVSDDKQVADSLIDTMPTPTPTPTPTPLPIEKTPDILVSSAQPTQEMPVSIEVADSAPVDQSDIYFDSIQRVVQQSDTLQSSGPTEVNPLVEPASKYLVVTDMKSKDSIESKIIQARRALKLGRYDAAYTYYDILYKKSPRDEAILMGRAVSLQKLGRESAAIDAYEKLLKLYPNNADALVNMLGLVKGQYPAVALQKLLSVRQSNPENAGVVAQIGLTYAAMNNYVDAKKYLNMAVSLEPNNALHAYNLAIIYDREGDRQQAIRYYDEALRTDAINSGGRSINRDVIYDRLSKLR